MCFYVYIKKKHCVLFYATWFLRVSFASTIEEQNFSANKDVRDPLHYAQALLIQPEESSGP
jgi:hypothetical protein